MTDPSNTPVLTVLSKSHSQPETLKYSSADLYKPRPITAAREDDCIGDKHKRREQKAKQARDEVIKELTDKRHDRQMEIRRIAEEEMKRIDKKHKQKLRAVNSKQQHTTNDTSCRQDEGNVNTESSSTSLLPDLLLAISQLEDDPAPLATPSSYRISKLRALTSEGENNDYEIPSPVEVYSECTEPGVLDTIAKQYTQSSKSSHAKLSHSTQPLSGSKLQDLLCYLESEDEKNSVALEESRHSKTNNEHQIPNTNCNSIISRIVPSKEIKQTTANTNNNTSDNNFSRQMLEDVTQVANDVTETILSQRFELDNSKKTLEILRKALADEREKFANCQKNFDKELKQRLRQEKKESELAIQRHLTFIDQLIDDKKELSDKCEKLVKELKDMDKKTTHRFNAMAHSHKCELERLKEVVGTAEKLKRDKWMDERTKKIKEMTIRGLEPEIQKLIQKHKSELQKVHSLHEAEMQHIEEKMSQRWQVQLEELRDKLEKEREVACAHERELARKKYEQLAEREELGYQQQRKKLYGEIQTEKERLSVQHTTLREELDVERKALHENHNSALAQLKQQQQLVHEEVEKRNECEKKLLVEKLEIEKEAFVSHFIKRKEEELMEKEKLLRISLKEERDKEIELVISQLERDSEQTREENDKLYEARFKRMREKFEKEVRDIENSERSTQELYSEHKNKLRNTEEEIDNLKCALQAKMKEITQLNDRNQKLNSERDKLSDVIRQEFADKLVATEEENRQVKANLSEMTARHRVTLERLENEKEEELNEIHTRVKQAVLKKEETLQTMKTQYEQAIKRADHLEMLLDKQRREVLKK